MIYSSMKRERRVRRQTHRRKATKAGVLKRFGENSGIRKHLAATANPITKPPRKNEVRPKKSIRRKRRAN